jgi:hypothetical protein
MLRRLPKPKTMSHNSNTKKIPFQHGTNSSQLGLWATPVTKPTTDQYPISIQCNILAPWSNAGRQAGTGITITGEMKRDFPARKSSDRTCGCNGHAVRGGHDHSTGIEWGDSVQNLWPGRHGDSSGWGYQLQYDTKDGFPDGSGFRESLIHFPQ